MDDIIEAPIDNPDEMMTVTELRPSKQTVREHCKRRSRLDAEIKEAAAAASSKDLKSGSARQRSKPGSAIPRAFEHVKHAEPRHDHYRPMFNVRKRITNIVAISLSHDGSSSNPDLPDLSTATKAMLTANIGEQEDDDDIKVPDHVDWRSAYGRRTTQDFGFPGARVKVYRKAKPPQPSNNLAKRIYGDFPSKPNKKVQQPTHCESYRRWNPKRSPPNKQLAH